MLLKKFEQLSPNFIDLFKKKKRKGSYSLWRAQGGGARPTVLL